MNIQESEDSLIKKIGKDKKIDGKDLVLIESLTQRTKQSFIPLFQEILEEKGYTITNENDLNVFNRMYKLIFGKESGISKMRGKNGEGENIFSLGKYVRADFSSLTIDKSGKIFLYKQWGFLGSFGYIENGKFYENTHFSLGDYKGNNNNFEIKSLSSQEKIPTGYHIISKTYTNGDIYTGKTNIGKKWGEGVYTWKDNSSYKGEFYNGRINNTKGIYTNINGISFSGNFENQVSNTQGDTPISKNTIKILSGTLVGMTCAELDNITNLEAYLIKEKNDGFPEVTGKTIANSLVKIIWPDGSTNETQSDKKGNYKISANTKQFGGEIRIKIPTEEEYDKKTKISNTSFSYKRENIYKENLLIYKIKKQKNEILSLNNPIIHIKGLENPFLKNLGGQQDKKENLNLPKQIIFKNLKIPHILFDYKNPKKQDIIDMLKMGRNMSEKEKIYSPAFIYALQVSLSILGKGESLGNIDGVWGNKTKKSLEILVKENGISPNEILSSQSIQNIINKLWII